MRDYVEKMIIQNSVVDINQVVKDVEELKQAMTFLFPTNKIPRILQRKAPTTKGLEGGIFIGASIYNSYFQ
ncbi:hypothetical protein NIES2101_08345 [Calothrix sp. HK-06]|nr:hypothetical protein NIES2101_08345 [Calothrix sp. HK-06]